jgi:serine protease Do
MKNLVKKHALVFLIAFAGGFAAYLLAGSFESGMKSNGNAEFFSERIPVSHAGLVSQKKVIAPDFIEAASQTINTVVHIKTQYQRKSSVYDDFFGFMNPWNDFFNQGRRGAYPIVATGSGVIISDDGYIATNNHVVQEADLIEVTLNDKRTFTARVIGTDPSTDLALLKIDAEGLQYSTFGNSDNLRIGEWVLAVGNPFNLTSTVTAGIVSARARNINILGSNTAIESFIQTDAAVNRGNSGGALVNTLGELVGVNAAIASNTGAYTGYSFAIPANLVKKVMDDLLKHGEVQRAFLGVSISDINSKLADEKKLKSLNGVYIAEVNSDGAADKAGLKSGDVIMSIDGMKVNSRSELLEIIGQRSPGHKVDLEVIREDKMKNITVTLRNRDNKISVVKREEVAVIDALGAEFRVATNEELKRLGLDTGVKVEKLLAGKMRSAGVREGFIITQVDKQNIESPEDITRILNNKRGGVLIEGVYPNGMRAYYGFGL